MDIPNHVREKMNVTIANPSWAKDFEIIQGSPNFIVDEKSIDKCNDCGAKCCFLLSSYRISRYDKIPDFEAIKEYFNEKDQQILKHNIDNMLDIVKPDKTIIFGNKNWYRIYREKNNEKDDGYILAFACPVLTSDEKCGIYPERFNMCKGYGHDNEYGRLASLICNFELLEEYKP